MVLVTSPRNRQAQKKNLSIQVAGVIASILLISAFALFWTSSSSSTATTTTTEKLSSLRLPIKSRLTKRLQQQQQHGKEKKWPALSEVYDGQKVIADPQFLLDFAILGFEKSGTSTLMKWLGSHPEVQCFQEEIYDLYRNRTGTLVWRLHSQTEPGFHYKRGYKSPIDVFNANAIHLLDQYFPKTRLLLALRHPVLYVSFLEFGSDLRRWEIVLSMSAELSHLHHINNIIDIITITVRISVQLSYSEFTRSRWSLHDAAGWHWRMWRKFARGLYRSFQFRAMDVPHGQNVEHVSNSNRTNTSQRQIIRLCQQSQSDTKSSLCSRIISIDGRQS